MRLVLEPAMAYALQIGVRYLRSKKRKPISVITAVAVTGVALGMAALLTVLSITSGFQDEFQNKVLGVNAHVLVLKYGLDFSEYPEVIDQARHMKGVKGAAPFIINEMMLTKGERISGVLVKGVDPSTLGSVLELPRQMIAGSLTGLRLPGAGPASSLDDASGELDALLRGAPDITETDEPVAARAKAPLTPSAVERNLRAQTPTLPDDDTGFFNAEPVRKPSAAVTRPVPGLIVGKALAADLALAIGDTVRLVAPQSSLDMSSFGVSTAPASRPFKVIGIFEAGFQEYDSRLVYADLYEVQNFFNHGDTVTGVELKLSDLSRSTAIARSLERKLGGVPYHTLDWRELNHNLFTALEMQKVALTLVIATILFVAAFNVIATLIMIVLEKRREIAILKAMGAPRRTIVGVFFVQGALIGVLGSSIGLCLGAIVCGYLYRNPFPLDPKVYLINHIPVRISLTEFGISVLIALGISFTATLIPSWWAARSTPASGLRLS